MSHVLAAVMAAGLAGGQPPAPARTDACPRLAELALDRAKVVSAEVVPAGSFSPPAAVTPWFRGNPALYKSVPAFCRVVVLAAPSADSAIDIEVWMPVEGWNGRFRGQGNGGFAGEINFAALASAAQLGYATAATNTGHSASGTDASWARGHPEKVIDFGYRAIHVMTQVAKAAIQAHYGRELRKSYFAACSNGGRQALMEAQRFPADYDGIVAGAPANNWTRLLTKAVADMQATTVDPASYIPPSKLPALARAVNGACDAQDGLRDGIVGDPPACRFDPASVLCQEGDSDGCLTPAQVTALRKLYEGPRDSKGGRIFPGFVPGAEVGGGGWGLWITGPSPGKSLMFAFGNGYFSNFVFEKPDWNYRTANPEKLLAAAQEKTGRDLNATDPDLGAFRARGGKLVLFHGWNDAAISPMNAIDYYESVASRLGRRETEEFARLYMIPGFQHCTGGPAPDSFGQNGEGPPDDPRRNVLLAVEQWVENGTPPSALVATGYEGEPPARRPRATRPVCPYPQVAKYAGTGDPNDAASFTCTPVKR
jgi:feruloyl esterase